AYTGMTWSGFRPSDDACRYGYLIPSNFFATVALEQIREMASSLGEDGLAKSAALLRGQILEGLAAYGTVEHPEYGRVYAYEVDGLGHAHLMDDANVPSLLSLPYLGCVKADDETYLRTRRMILSRTNPYYYEGKSARGIGSPHTPEDYIWPISLCMQGLTSTDPEEIRSLLSTLENLDAGTLLMHEGVHKDDPSQYTRAWFAWANSLFSEFVEFAVS
ncbi:MAG: glycoside hydrolase family 125 protein, partial [Clostridia bacterium]|nr:glycoside hydrolase family 125 protein [Clostridia bacterium]